MGISDRLSVYEFASFPFGLVGGMWNLSVLLRQRHKENILPKKQTSKVVYGNP